ncbi:MAG: dihydropteroate synthase, partial [Gemmataceae bacterium]
MIWKAANKTLDLSTGPKVMGILNVTPDSFSDGGKFNSVQVAIDHALRMEDQGAAIIDIGGESTRPGAEHVDCEEEIRRVVPVVKALAERTSVILSIDTTKSEVAEACLNLGAHAINDISGLTFDPKMMDVARNKTCGWMLMHIQGTPKTMQKSPTYTAVAKEVTEF